MKNGIFCTRLLFSVSFFVSNYRVQPRAGKKRSALVTIVPVRIHSTSTCTVHYKYCTRTLELLVQYGYQVLVRTSKKKAGRKDLREEKKEHETNNKRRAPRHIRHFKARALLARKRRNFKKGNALTIPRLLERKKNAKICRSPSSSVPLWAPRPANTAEEQQQQHPVAASGGRRRHRLRRRNSPP